MLCIGTLFNRRTIMNLMAGSLEDKKYFFQANSKVVVCKNEIIIENCVMLYRLFYYSRRSKEKRNRNGTLIKTKQQTIKTKSNQNKQNK